MKNVVFIILMFIANCLANEQQFSKFALCTFSYDAQYCAISNSKAIFLSDTSNFVYTLTSITGDVYTFTAINKDIVSKHDGVTYSVVNEQINGNGNKEYIAMKSEHIFIVVDNLTGCYIKKYYEGNVLEEYNVIKIDISDFFGFYMECIKETRENQ